MVPTKVLFGSRGAVQMGTPPATNVRSPVILDAVPMLIMVPWKERGWP